MSDRVLIPLGALGTLDMPREVFEQYLTRGHAPIAASAPSERVLVNAKTLAKQLDLPKTTIYESAKSGRIPCEKLGRRVLFDPAAVMLSLQGTGIKAGRER